MVGWGGVSRGRGCLARGCLLLQQRWLMPRVHAHEEGVTSVRTMGPDW